MPENTIKPKRKANRWQVDIRLPGDRNKRYRRSFPLTPEGKKQAELFIETIISGNSSDISLTELVDRYHLWGQNIKGKSPNTTRTDRIRLKIFLQWAATRKIKYVDRIDLKAIDNFQAYFFKNSPFDQSRVKKRYNPLNTKANWQRYREVISGFLNWCMELDLTADNPAKHKRFLGKTQTRIPPHFTPEEMEILQNYFGEEKYQYDAKVNYMLAIVDIISRTGMRPRELERLEWKHVDLKQRIIRIDEQTKNKEPRILPINAKLFSTLEGLPQDTKLVLDNGHGRFIYSWSWVLRRIHRACHDLKIPRRRTYDLRHTFASNLVKNKVDISLIKEFLGHQRIESTLIYLHFRIDDKRQAIEMLEY